MGFVFTFRTEPANRPKTVASVILRHKDTKASWLNMLVFWRMVSTKRLSVSASTMSTSQLTAAASSTSKVALSPTKSVPKVDPKYLESERVLCYEPDPTKVQVIYDAKVLQVSSTTLYDHPQGRGGGVILLVVIINHISVGSVKAYSYWIWSEVVLWDPTQPKPKVRSAATLDRTRYDGM
jgi:hypothetical protein